MGKKILKRFAMGCAAGAMLVAAGCGGGGGSSSVTAANVSGVVADGYLVGAEVFVDMDGDKVWDADEPKATTGAGGAYTLEGVSADDIAAYPLVVIVPADAVDEDTPGVPVGKEYLMSAPPGHTEFVSPLTTLVHNRLEENPALGVGAAVEAVKAQLGMTGATVDLFKDYVAQKTDAESSDDRNNYAKAHEIAKVVAGVVKDNMEAVREAVGGTVPPEQLDAAFKVALKQVADNLPVIVEKVSVAIEDPQSGGSVDVQGIMQELAGQVVIGPGAVTSALTEQEQKAPAVASSFQDALAGDGLYWFEMDEFDGQLFFEYGIVKLGTATQSMFPLTEQLFYFEGGNWVEGQSSEGEYVLTANGWIAEDDGAAAGKVMFLADGSAVWVRTLSGFQEKITISAMNMGGKKIMIPGGEGMSASDAVYPVGSVLYRTIFTPLQDVYSYMGGSAQFPSFTNLDTFMAAYAATEQNRNRVVMGENFGFQFGAQTAQDAGEVKFYTNPFSPGAQLLPLTGSWKKKLVHGQTILTVTIPAGYKRQYMDMDMNEELIFFVQDGGIQQGHVEYANIPDMQDDLNFNKTAFEAFEAAWRSSLMR